MKRDWRTASRPISGVCSRCTESGLRRSAGRELNSTTATLNRPLDDGRGARSVSFRIVRNSGGWKSTRMPLQYAEKINAARSGMARAAAATGRDEPVSE